MEHNATVDSVLERHLHEECKHLTAPLNSKFLLNFREVRSKAPTQILLNLCIALSFTLVVFLIAAERSKTSSMASCRAAAVALHYFVLVAFMWMAIEAFNMYLAFVKVMPSHYSARFMLKFWVAGWGR